MEIAFIPLLAGFIFAGLGGYIIFDYYRFNDGAIKVQGTILRYHAYQSRDTDNIMRTMYRPYFSFTVNDRVYEVKSSTSYANQIIPVGQNVAVLYQQGDEANARLNQGNNYWLGIVFIVISIPAIYLGLF
ncbi:DUF3592 domain-containing protein [Paraglaciecola sp. 2405UD69-4]|uniref:DUF3592 domain-containing protein n=1 Tax=Paraglaciecola sp. 2405UD69-4 TaxID=3391836 RepID=UPI0039C99480